MKISALDRKLLRDLWGMRGQALAIALVVAAGVAMFVTYLSNFDSLQRTQDAYYEHQRFAQVFASLERAPHSLEARIAELPGIARVDTRVVADVSIDVPGLPEPASGRLISLPERGRPRLNDVFLRRGRLPDPARGDEVLASEAFCAANRFELGSRVSAIINGRKRPLTIVGIALSPEYVYSIPPGRLIPDDRRYAILWMGRRALASAFDMEGGFNDVAVALAPGTSVDEAITHLDRVLEPFGGLGAIPRSLQLSAWTLENELIQLKRFGFLIPAIFLGVAAFVLNVAMTRALSLQRAQIAALKALGYSNGALAWHYVKWALMIAAAGALAGCGVGAWLGRAMIGLYNEYFRFPELAFRLTPGVALQAAGLSLAAAAVGAWSAVRRAVRIPPAEAMRPEPPARYRESRLEVAALRGRLTHATRMIVRNLERQPWRAAASVVGIALAMAILLLGFQFIDAMDRLVELHFELSLRNDMLVTLVQPRSEHAAYELGRLPGVIRVEPQRVVPARLRAGHRHRNLAITGLPAEPLLRRIVDQQGRTSTLPPDGLVLSKLLAEVLDVSPGESVRVEVLEGERPARELRISGTVDDLMGLSAYMEQGALHRFLREGGAINAASLLIDPAEADRLYRTLKGVPAVAGVALTDVALASFRDVMAQNMDLTITFNVAFASIIAFGVVYNAARISLSERSRDLASLRVLGFTRAEISLILLGELAIVTVLALPVGAALGYGMGWVITGWFASEVYRIPFHPTLRTVAWSALVVALAAAFSGFAVRRRLDRLDLVAVLKTRE